MSPLGSARLQVLQMWLDEAPFHVRMDYIKSIEHELSLIIKSDLQWPKVQGLINHSLLPNEKHSSHHACNNSSLVIPHIIKNGCLFVYLCVCVCVCYQ